MGLVSRQTDEVPLGHSLEAAASTNADARRGGGELTDNGGTIKITAVQQFKHLRYGLVGTRDQQTSAGLRIAKNAAPPLRRVRRQFDLVPIATPVPRGATGADSHLRHVLRLGE